MRAFRRGNLPASAVGGARRLSLAFAFVACLVRVAIRTVDSSKEPIAQALNCASRSRHVEAATRPHRHPPDIAAALCPRRNNRTHHVARLKPPYNPRLLRAGTWKAVLVHAAHLPRAMAARSYQERPDA